MQATNWCSYYTAHTIHSLEVLSCTWSYVCDTGVLLHDVQRTNGYGWKKQAKLVRLFLYPRKCSSLTEHLGHESSAREGDDDFFRKCTYTQVQGMKDTAGWIYSILSNRHTGASTSPTCSNYVKHKAEASVAAPKYMVFCDRPLTNTSEKGRRYGSHFF